MPTNTRHQTSVNIAPATKRQVQELTALGYGSFTEINRLAIHDLHTRATQPPVTIRHGKLTITVDNVDQARAILGLLDSPLTEDVQP